jgi:hypothetical protein
MNELREVETLLLAALARLPVGENRTERENVVRGLCFGAPISARAVAGSPEPVREELALAYQRNLIGYLPLSVAMEQDWPEVVGAPLRRLFGLPA